MSLLTFLFQVMNTKYVLEGYSITKNSASTMLAMHALRKTLIKYYVQSLIFFTIRHSKFLEWIAMFLQTPQVICCYYIVCYNHGAVGGRGLKNAIPLCELKLSVIIFK